MKKKRKKFFCIYFVLLSVLAVGCTTEKVDKNSNNVVSDTSKSNDLKKFISDKNISISNIMFLDNNKILYITTNNDSLCFYVFDSKNEKLLHKKENVSKTVNRIELKKTKNGVSYFDGQDVVLLDFNLEELARINLSDAVIFMIPSYAFSNDSKLIAYTTIPEESNDMLLHIRNIENNTEETMQFTYLDSTQVAGLKDFAFSENDKFLHFLGYTYMNIGDPSVDGYGYIDLSNNNIDFTILENSYFKSKNGKTLIGSQPDYYNYNGPRDFIITLENNKEEKISTIGNESENENFTINGNGENIILTSFILDDNHIYTEFKIRIINNRKQAVEIDMKDLNLPENFGYIHYLIFDINSETKEIDYLIKDVESNELKSGKFKY